VGLSPLAQLVRAPRAALEFANVVLTAPDAVSAATPRDVVWTYRTTTLYRYRSDRREHAVPVLLVFALINRPDVFDLRPGHSFVEHLLEEGFDVYLLDWGVPDECRSRPGQLRVRRASVRHPRDAALQRAGRGHAAGLVHRGDAVRDALRARQPRPRTS